MGRVVTVFALTSTSYVFAGLVRKVLKLSGTITGVKANAPTVPLEVIVVFARFAKLPFAEILNFTDSKFPKLFFVSMESFPEVSFPINAKDKFMLLSLVDLI
ncbi:hypothetical protein D3C87_1767980 [compost metagenome]